MKPIKELLDRIRWDAEFARGDFQLGYFDRIEKRIVLVPFKEAKFPDSDSKTFQILDAEGITHRVPFHRVREVYKNSQRIWHRPEPGVD